MRGVAFLQTDASGENDVPGGALRFFIDIFRHYHLRSNKRFRLYFLTSRKTKDQLARDTYFAACFRWILPLWSPNNRFNEILANTDLLGKVVLRRIRLIHVCQYYHVAHYRRLLFLQRLPAFIRPRIVINWIHCNFPYEYSDPTHYNYTDFHQRFDPLFNNVKVDGVFAWYQLTKRFIEENKLIKSEPLIHPISTYCCNTDKYKPAAHKENLVIWAARLHKQKRPGLFVEAVNWLHKNHPAQIAGWQFMLCGSGGTEEETLRKQIAAYNLDNTISFRTDINDMSELFGRSKCFVSTQDYENFTSLSMNEALASGNALVARNVGQTNFYIKDGRNGFLAREDSAAGIGQAILAYITDPQRHGAMQEASLQLVREVHNTQNFIQELDDFWQKILDKKQAS